MIGIVLIPDLQNMYDDDLPTFSTTHTAFTQSIKKALNACETHTPRPLASSMSLESEWMKFDLTHAFGKDVFGELQELHRCIGQQDTSSSTAAATRQGVESAMSAGT